MFNKEPLALQALSRQIGILPSDFARQYSMHLEPDHIHTKQIENKYIY